MHNFLVSPFLSILFAAFVLVIAVVARNVWQALILTITVFEYQRAILYKNGKLDRVLDAGKYHFWRPSCTFTVVDTREQQLTVINQEIVSADNLGLRLSVACVYKVVDPVLAMQQTTSYFNGLYLEAQFVLRQLTTGLKVEEVLNKRNELSSGFVEGLKEPAKRYGLEIVSGGLKDITLPADVKKIFAQVGQAERAAQASLAKSRSEVASLRALSNAAKMMESNPHLVTLRTLGSISELSQSTGNTIVFGMPAAVLPMSAASSAEKSSPPPDASSDGD